MNAINNKLIFTSKPLRNYFLRAPLGIIRIKDINHNNLLYKRSKFKKSIYRLVSTHFEVKTPFPLNVSILLKKTKAGKMTL